MKNFEFLFLKKFTRELIKNSIKTYEISSQKLLRERIRQRLQEKYNDKR